MRLLPLYPPNTTTGCNATRTVAPSRDVPVVAAILGSTGCNAGYYHSYTPLQMGRGIGLR